MQKYFKISYVKLKVIVEQMAKIKKIVSNLVAFK